MRTFSCIQARLADAEMCAKVMDTQCTVKRARCGRIKSTTYNSMH